MKFYRMTAKIDARFAYASGYGALESMPYLDCLDASHRDSMLRFWQANPSSPGLQIDPGGREWPNCIWVGLGWPHQCFTNRVIADLDEAGIRPLRMTHMPIASVAAKRLLKQAFPEYYVIEGVPGYDLDYHACGIPVDSDGKPLFHLRDKSNKQTPAIRLSTWNGNDIVSCRGVAPIIFACTERVKQLAGEKGWTGVQFKELPVVP